MMSSADFDLSNGHLTGQYDEHGQIHVSGIIIILIELALTFENLLPILVCLLWLPCQKIGDKQICVFSTLCILSALVPTPLGLVSYFSGGWYGGSATCVTYQVTSLWCGLSSLVMLTYMSVTCHLVVCCLLNIKKQHYPNSSNLDPSSPVTGSISNRVNQPQDQPVTGSGSQQQCSRSNENANLNTDQHEENNSRRNLSGSENRNKSPDEGNADGNAADDGNAVGEGNAPQKANISEKSNEENTIRKPTYTSFKKTPQVKADPLQKSNWNTTDNTSDLDIDNEMSAGVTDDTEGQESSASLPCSDTDKSVVYLDVYSRSKMVKNWLRNDVHAKHRFDRPAADTICQTCPSKDYMALTVVVLFSMTMAISLLPMMGWGPRTDLNDTLCEPWIVHRPSQANEAVFFISYLIFVSMCLATGCYSGINVCRQVRKRIGEYEQRRSRVYYEKDNVNEIWELSVLSDVRKQYRLSCVALAGQLTWIPLEAIMILQIWGVTISDAVIMYTIVVTSLPGLVNPLLYSLVLSSYRSGYKAILGKRCCLGSKINETVVAHTLLQAGMDQNMNISITNEACLCQTDQSNINIEDDTRVVIFPDSDASDDMAYDPFYPHLTLNELTPLQARPVTSAGTFETTFTNEENHNKSLDSKMESKTDDLSFISGRHVPTIESEL